MKIAFRLLSYIRLVAPLFTIGMILLILSTLGTQLAPLIIQYTMDEVLTPAWNGASDQLPRLIPLLSAYTGLTAISSVIGYVATRTLMHSTNKIGEYLRNQAYDKMQQLPISYFDDKPAGKIASRIVNDTETLRSQFYGTVVSQMLVNLLPVLFVYGILFYLNIVLGVILLFLIPIFVIWQHVYNKKTNHYMKMYYEAQSDVNSSVNEAMNGSSILQLFQQEEATIQQFESVARKMYDADKGMIKIESTISWGLVELIKRLFIFMILAYVSYQFLGGIAGVSAGIIFSYINYSERLFNSLGMLVRLLPTLQRSFTTGRRVLELLDEVSESDTSQELVVTQGEVRFESVTFGYNPDVPVLKNISITAKKGETVALVGHTGSGKSSIMNLLFRFYDAQKGRILIDGQDITLCNRESVRKDMGIVLQDPYLFTGTIATNVAMDNEEMSRETILEALEQVGAEDMLNRLEKGIDEPVVEKGNSFSSGEKQLISFARTLASNPKILILDEATSHIDTQTEEVIQKAMNVVKQGRTTFIIAHRLSTIQTADQILVLHEGEIIERGTHQELLSLNGQYAEMYRMQQKI